MKNLMKKILPFSALLIGANMSVAATELNVACPSTAEINQYQFGATFPYGYDNATQQVKYLVGASLSGAPTDKWLLVMNQAKIAASEDTTQAVNNIITNLTNVTPTPLTFGDNSGLLNIPFCIYSLPNQPDLNAIAYNLDLGFDDDDDDDYDDDYDDDDYAHSKSKSIAHAQHQHTKTSKWMKVLKSLTIK